MSEVELLSKIAWVIGAIIIVIAGVAADATEWAARDAALAAACAADDAAREKQEAELRRICEEVEG